MKLLVNISVFLFATSSLALYSAALPWNISTHKAYKLPNKDKEKLNSIFTSAKSLIIKNHPDFTLEWFNHYTKSSIYGDKYAEFNKSTKELREQIDRINMSLSGILSSLTWRERLEQLKESLFAIAVAIEAEKTIPIAQSMANYVTTTINDLIGNINGKAAK